MHWYEWVRVHSARKSKTSRIKVDRLIALVIFFQDFDSVQQKRQEERAAVPPLQVDHRRRCQSSDKQSVGRRLVGVVHAGQEPWSDHLQGSGAWNRQKSRQLTRTSRRHGSTALGGRTCLTNRVDCCRTYFSGVHFCT